ncbi:EboA domain-containing protein [Micromonospora sp. M12]
MLRALPLLPIGGAGVPLLHDAIRTNDTRLVAAALGPYARHLDPAAWRQAVLKCVFSGVPRRGGRPGQPGRRRVGRDAGRPGRRTARRRP